MDVSVRNFNTEVNTMTHEAYTSGFKLGGIAFLAGVLATLVTAFAVARRRSPQTEIRPEYGGYDADLGI
jgi:hypothetical protein